MFSNGGRRVEDAISASVIALSVGSLALASAAIVSLLHRTRGAPPARRAALMARLAGSSVWSIAPSRETVAALVAGFLAFANSWAVGILATVGLALAIKPDPPPTEAYEGFGDAMLALFIFGAGAVLSLGVAAVLGLVVGERVALRLAKRAERAAAPDRHMRSL